MLCHLSQQIRKQKASPNRLPLTRAIIFLLVLLVVNSGCAKGWTPDASIISKMEAGIKPSDIPPRYSPGRPPIIGQYARYYFGYKAHNRRMIHGVLILPFGPKMKPAGIYVVRSQREFPVILDGGCSVMHLVYDLEANQIVSLECNGLA
ncbi:MAG TPA: hypothetical protein VGE93_17215 [Bryobacteraceae bacterium]